MWYTRTALVMGMMELSLALTFPPVMARAQRQMYSRTTPIPADSLCGHALLGGSLSLAWQERNRTSLSKSLEAVVTNDRELTTLCQRFANPDDSLTHVTNTAPVNFLNTSIVFIGLGARPAYGFHIRLDSVVTRPRQAIYYTEVTPGPCPTPQEIIFPVFAARVRTMRGAVQFVRHKRRNRHC